MNKNEIEDEDKVDFFFLCFIVFFMLPSVLYIVYDIVPNFEKLVFLFLFFCIIDFVEYLSKYLSEKTNG